MVSKKIYEDVLDDIDEIKSDVQEEHEDKYPIFRDGYAHTILISGQHSINTDKNINIMPDALKVYLNKYSDDYRMAVISSKEDMAEFTEETGLDEIDDDDDWPHTVVQFNATWRNTFRLIFWIFSVGTYFMRFIRSGNKWKPHTQGDVFDVYDLVRGTHMEIKNRHYLHSIVTDMTLFAGFVSALSPDSEAYVYARKIVETYNERFGKRKSGQKRTRTSQ